jgi:hypothetical protein
VLQRREPQGLELEFFSESIFLDTKRATIVGFLKATNYLIGHCHLHAYISHKAIAPTLQETRPISEEPIYASEQAGIPERAASSPSNHL